VARSAVRAHDERKVVAAASLAILVALYWRPAARLQLAIIAIVASAPLQLLAFRSTALPLHRSAL